MTGRVAKEIRKRLGLNAHAFAAVMGIHLSTVYRWEGCAGVISPAPLQAEILDRLFDVADAEVGERARKALLENGHLAGLRVLIDAIMEES